MADGTVDTVVVADVVVTQPLADDLIRELVANRFENRKGVEVRDGLICTVWTLLLVVCMCFVFKYVLRNVFLYTFKIQRMARRLEYETGWATVGQRWSQI